MFNEILLFLEKGGIFITDATPSRNMKDVHPKGECSMGNTKHFKSGEIIIRENETGVTAYSIDQGVVRVTKKSENKTIHICDLRAGNIFGEMGMIDDKPRSATVTAITDTTVYEIHRDNFFIALKNEEELAIKILKIVFERLRIANAKIAELMVKNETPVKKIESILCNYPKQKVLSVHLTASSRYAVKAMPKNPIHIKEFPFRIGRETRDPLAYNDLALIDKPPYRISRHHMELDVQDGKLVAIDRGSYLGTIVNGKKLGGAGGNPGPIIFQGVDGKVMLGGKKSPYLFKMKIISN